MPPREVDRRKLQVKCGTCQEPWAEGHECMVPAKGPPMIEPNKDLLADGTIPRVKLDGVEWPIPRLSIKQLMVVTPLIQLRMPQIAKFTGVEPMSAEMLQDVATIVFQGLSKGHKITRAEFDEMTVGFLELFEAAVVVASQTGMRKKTETNGVSPGEAAGALSTGTG